MLDLWERSVRATHSFLTEEDIADLRPHVAQELESTAVEWFVASNEDGHVMGFLANTPGCIEGLFIDPRYHRRGFGRLLVAHAQALAGGPLRLDVNEGNSGAIDFYQSQGFAVVGRSATGGEGRPFPVLHMERSVVPSPGAV
jgi:putative acetyltransferase